MIAIDRFPERFRLASASSRAEVLNYADVDVLAFIDSFAFALRAELKDTGVTVTCLVPGATETDSFARADLLDTKVGQEAKDDPVDVAKVGFQAMMRGDGDVVSGWRNKLQSALTNITPASMLAEQHRKKTEPGSGLDKTG